MIRTSDIRSLLVLPALVPAALGVGQSSATRAGDADVDEAVSMGVNDIAGTGGSVVGGDVGGEVGGPVGGEVGGEVGGRKSHGVGARVGARVSDDDVVGGGVGDRVGGHDVVRPCVPSWVP